MLKSSICCIEMLPCEESNSFMATIGYSKGHG
ncbi:hypothetical protein AAZX31_18G277800 [Glycine max]